jgi:hypothetical protein
MEIDPEAELRYHLETQSDSDDESDHVASNSPWRSHDTNKQQNIIFPFTMANDDLPSESIPSFNLCLEFAQKKCCKFSNMVWVIRENVTISLHPPTYPQPIPHET